MVLVLVWRSLSLCLRRKEEEERERKKWREGRLKSVLAQYDEYIAMAKSGGFKD